jgi:hypothetical protein
MINSSYLNAFESKVEKNFQIVVYDTKCRPSQKLGGFDVTTANSNLKSRWEVLNQFPNQWICFFDADCEVNETLVKRVHCELSGLSQSTILCGRYSNQSNSSSIERAYNFICNTWLEAGLKFNYPRLLGGFFVVYSSVDLRSMNFSEIPRWGGEDLHFARLADLKSFKLKLIDGLCVVHKPNTSLRHFIFRSFVQGKNRIGDSHRNLGYWFSELSKNSWEIKLIVIFHLFVVLIGNAYSVLKKVFKNPRIVLPSLNSMFFQRIKKSPKKLINRTRPVDQWRINQIS